MRYLFGQCQLDTTRRELYFQGQLVKIEPQVYEVLTYLIRHRHRIVSKNELLQNLWPGMHVQDNALTRCIRTIRRTIGCNARTQTFIMTHHGIGYSFRADVDEQFLDASAPSILSPLLPIDNPLDGEAKRATLLCWAISRPTEADVSGKAKCDALFDQVIGEAFAHITACEGTILYVDDTDLLALFGAPIAHEDHARLAVRAALAICRLWEEHRRQERQTSHDAQRSPDPWPHGGIGVHTARVMIWRHAHRSQSAWPMLGEARALVSQIAARAEPGAVHLSHTTAELVRGLHPLTVASSMSASGTSGPTPIYQIIQTSRSTPAAQQPLSPFEGRSRELAILHHRLQEALNGRGQVVSIIGAPGMGKSRLLTEFRRRLHGRSAHDVEGRCVASTSAALRAWINQICALLSTDPPAVIRDKLSRALHEAGLDPADGATALLALLGMQAGPAQRSAQQAEALARQGLATLLQLILNRSYQQPLLLIAEDLQASDPLFDRLCAMLADSLLEAPILLLATCRLGAQPPWLTRSATTQLTLQPLAVTESRTIVSATSGTTALPSAVQDTILDRAAGNPLFLEVWTRAVLEGSFRMDTPTAPITIEDALLARIDHLPIPAKQLLHTAAVLGPTGQLRLLQALWDGPESMEALVDVLQQRAILGLRLGLSEPEYAFTHMLIQETAYDNLLPLRRRLLHRRAGQAIETLYAGRLAAVCESLAFHYEQALASADIHPAADPVAHRLELALSVAQAWSFLGRFAESQKLLEPYRQQVEHLQRPELVGRYYFRLSRTYSLLGDHAQASAYTQQALAAASQGQDMATLGQVHYELARERFLTGPPRQSLRHGETAVRLLSQTGAQWWLGMAHWAVGVAYALMGDFSCAFEALARTDEIGGMLQDPHLQSYAALTTGWSQAITAASEASIEQCRRGRDLATDPVNMAHAVGALGYAHAERHEALEAIPLLQQAAQSWQQFGMPAMQGWLTTGWADAVRLQGDLPQARQLARQALALAESSAFPYAIGLAHRVRGRIALHGEQHQEARFALRQALQTFSAIEARFELGRTYLISASLAHTVGDQQLATRRLRKAARLFEALHIDNYRARTAQDAQAYGVSLQEPHMERTS